MSPSAPPPRPAVGLYVHVPFCESRCIYCDFYSTTQGAAMRREYADALVREMRHRALEAGSLRSVYFGGGTPSTLSPDLWRQIFDGLRRYFRLDADAEVTVEMNPDDVTSELLRTLREEGVNRVSIGVQSLHDDTLRLLRRRHDAETARHAVRLLQDEGLRNISLDLIYGLPGQALEDFRRDLEEALSLGITHLSAYALSVEEGTALSRMVERGEWEETSQEVQAAMYEMLMAVCERNGFEHYEVSNFSLPGMRSRHNSSYWTSLPYLGLGPGAASYDGGARRRNNLPSLAAYVNSLDGDVPHEDELLSADELYNELLMLRLRTCEGLPLGLLSPEEQQTLLAQVAPHLASARMTLTDSHLRFTRQGLFLSDGILSELVRV